MFVLDTRPARFSETWQVWSEVVGV